MQASDDALAVIQRIKGLALIVYYKLVEQARSTDMVACHAEDIPGLWLP